ncbi:MAG: hypothetical protein FWF24_01655 [Alphaproteobacteria bacterium]|nr:hypothetical protein [Alphaproteobacteria bacterium]
MNYSASVIHLPEGCLFPKTAEAFIWQAKAFTGKEIVMDPHWRATSSLWLDSDGSDSYGTFLRIVQKKENRLYSAFVSSHDDLGAYIVYADHGKRWNGSLNGRSEDDEKVDMLCHETGHLLTSFDIGNFPVPEKRYFNEQCAILGANMLKTAIGNKGILCRDFPKFKAYQPQHVQEGMLYDSFCIYTPSPLARYYETPDGRVTGQSRYLSSSGVIRFDLVAQDLTKSALHLRQHLSAMQLFGGIALELANNPTFVDLAMRTIPCSNNARKRMAHKPRDEYAKAILKHWWKAAQDALGWKDSDAIKNLYVGEQEQFPSIHHANSYFLNLAAATQHAMVKRPDDYLLPIVHQGLVSLMTRSDTLPAITSKITTRCEDGNVLRKPRGGLWSWLRQRVWG